MNDLFFEKRRSNNGCLISGLVFLLLVGVGIWFFFFRDRESDPKRNGPNDAPPEHTDPGTRSGENTPLPPIPLDGPDRSKDLLEDARRFLAAHDPGQARRLGFEALDQARNPDVRNQIEQFLGNLHTRMLQTPMPMEEKTDYTIKPGDTLGVLARKFGTTVELIQKSNNLRSSLIRVGDRIRIFQGTFTIFVDKSDNDLLVKLNDRFFKRYRVGTGQYNRTPVGEFKINDKIAEPPWWRGDGKMIPYGDKENLLGTRWLSLDIRGYGIHGTWEPDTIGQQLSAGCVRMLNEDVEELFDYIPLGTAVQITD